MTSVQPGMTSGGTGNWVYWVGGSKSLGENVKLFVWPNGLRLDLDGVGVVVVVVVVVISLENR